MVYLSLVDFLSFFSHMLYWQVDYHVKATGGGAYKFADLFKERLGVSLDKEDEMDCLVAGANFLLKVENFYFFLMYHLECACCYVIFNYLIGK